MGYASVGLGASIFPLSPLLEDPFYCGLAVRRNPWFPFLGAPGWFSVVIRRRFWSVFQSDIGCSCVGHAVSRLTAVFSKLRPQLRRSIRHDFSIAADVALHACRQC